MIQSFLEIFHVINTQILIISILLFFVGYAIAPTAYYKKIKWLTAYPFFIIKLMDAFFKKKHHPLKIFFILFTLNTLSLFLNLISAWGILLPFIFVLYMGLNIGVVMYHSLEGKFYYIGLLNPVAILELPAAWLSITMAMQFSLQHYLNISFLPTISFLKYVDYFLYTIIPLLLLAGIIETILIVKNEKDNNAID
ncbi:MAG: stage II sporulation protein M [Calditrichia bacterium]|jgi:hypothetical protein|nr:stage II sporulation protein M [Calditrichia bacterium]